MGKSKPTSFRITVISDAQEHCPGSYIQGNVFLELSKDMIPLKAITIQLFGMASLKFRDGYNHKEKKDICRLTWVIWRNEASPQQQAGYSTGLSAGQYEFPFKVQIPADQVLLSSFEGPYGVIQYSLTAGIARSEKMELEYTTTKPIIVRESVSTNIPRLMEPASKHGVRRMKTSKHGGGSIFFSVKIDRRGYCPGESISINAKFENQSNTQVDAIQASLVQEATYTITKFTPNYQNPITHHWEGPRTFVTKKGSKRIIQKIESSGIPPGKTGYWNNELLPIPAISPTTIGDNIIVLSYTVDISAVIHKAGSFTFLIPVTIGTTSFGQSSSTQVRQQNDTALS